MKYLVTGASGFIGSHLVDVLLSQGNEVVALDNFSTGIIQYLDNAKKSPYFNLHHCDLLTDKIDKYLENVDTVFHLAANADIKDGLIHPFKDIEQGVIVTFNVLESMRRTGTDKIVFSSSAAAIGEPENFPTPENLPFPIQTSLYGTSKMACEGLISSYCLGYGLKGVSFRFVSLLGPRYPHGHVYDFVKQLLNKSDQLVVLGDGKQRKSYMHINDCIEALNSIPSLVWSDPETKNGYDVFNLGNPEYCILNESINEICEELNLSPKITYTGGDRGWIGDNPFVFLDVSKALSKGWSPKNKIKSAIRETARWLVDNQWIYNVRK